MERSRFQLATGAAGVVAIPAAIASMLLAAGGGALAPIGFLGLALVAAVGPLLTKKIRPMIHNSVARKSLPPSSQRLLPPGPVEEGAVDGSAAEPRKKRPRGLRRKPASRKVHFDFKQF